MCCFLGFIGGISFLAGVSLILFPRQLNDLNASLSRLITSIDDTAIKLRLGFGVSLILTTACIWFIAYYIKVMPVLRHINQSL